MKKQIFIIYTLMITPAFGETGSDLTPYLLQSRGAVKVLGTSLKQKLVSSMKTSGPEAAIAVCNVEAVPLTDKVSLEKGLTISRTSLKYRNSINAPNDWEKSVLIQFQQRKDKGESLKKMEFSELVFENNKKQFRYMKAMPTGEPCLTCHGDAIKPNLKKKLASLYPNDKATGFKLGDLRGAFSVTIPVK